MYLLYRGKYMYYVCSVMCDILGAPMMCRKRKKILPEKRKKILCVKL